MFKEQNKITFSTLFTDFAGNLIYVCDDSAGGFLLPNICAITYIQGWYNKEQISSTNAKFLKYSGLIYLGSTGERICVCGDSAGGNLAIAIAMRASSMNIRLPEGIQTTYGCQLVRYTPSPSRMMALMDPLLPLGIISRCLAGKLKHIPI